MRSDSHEVAAFDVLSSIEALRRRWLLVVAFGIAGAIVGMVSTWLVPPIWEARASLQLGVVRGVPLEDATVLATFIESEGAQGAIIGSWRLTDAVPVRAQAPKPSPAEAAAAYLTIQTRAGTADEARNLAVRVAERVEMRHKAFFDAASAGHTEYGTTLTRTLAGLEQGIHRIEAGLASLGGGKEAQLTALLLQSTLDANRLQYLTLLREVRDANLADAVGTRPTKRMSEPSVPSEPVWPSRLAFIVIGAAAGLLAGVVGVLLLGVSRPSSQTS